MRPGGAEGLGHRRRAFRSGPAGVPGRRRRQAAAGPLRCRRRRVQELLATCNSPGAPASTRCPGPGLPRGPGQAAGARRPQPEARPGQAHRAGQGRAGPPGPSSSDHFVVRSHNAKLSKLLVVEAEAALSRVCKLILGGQDYPNTVDIYVWTDHEDYIAHAQDAPEWSGELQLRLQGRRGRAAHRPHASSTTSGGSTPSSSTTSCRTRCRTWSPANISAMRLAPVPQRGPGDAQRVGRRQRPAAPGRHRARRRAEDRHGGPLPPQTPGPPRRERLLRRVLQPAVLPALAIEQSAVQGSLLESVKNGCTMDDALHRVLYVPQDNSLMVALSLAWQKDALEQAQYLRPAPRTCTRSCAEPGSMGPPRKQASRGDSPTCPYGHPQSMKMGRGRAARRDIRAATVRESGAPTFRTQRSDFEAQLRFRSCATKGPSLFAPRGRQGFGRGHSESASEAPGMRR